MKVGGNESATKFFQQNGGTAALNSKDPKTKYQSNAATKYKDELKRRAARDAQEYVSAPQTPPLTIADMCPVTLARL
jgi:ADP-ribosylation factor GTPase-activating protein 2/3